MFALVIMVGALGIGYIWASQLARNLSMERQRRYGWAQVGDLVEERFTLHNDSWIPLLWAEMRDQSDLPGYKASRALGMGSRTSMRWTTSGRCNRRGVYTLGPISLSTGDPFGLFHVTMTSDLTDTFVVYPPITALPRLIEPRGRMRGTAQTNVRSLDFTTNASSVRQYVPGDALKRIHWRSTARRSMPDREQFYVKEFDLEPSGDLWLILDMDPAVHVGEDVESTEEYAVLLAASLANEMLRANHAVGLISHGPEHPVILPPQKGHGQLWEILKALAGLHATSPLSLMELLQMFEPLTGRGITAAVVTPSTQAEWLVGLSLLLRHGTHVSGLLLEPQSFGGQGDMRGVLGALADLGISGHVITKDLEFDQFAQQRQQEPEYRVLGTGRVVVVKPGQEADWVTVGQQEGGVA